MHTSYIHTYTHTSPYTAGVGGGGEADQLRRVVVVCCGLSDRGLAASQVGQSGTPGRQSYTQVGPTGATLVLWYVGG